MEIDKSVCFQTPIYTITKKEWVKQLNIVADEHIELNKDYWHKFIKDRNSKLTKDIGDFAIPYHSKLMTGDTRLREFEEFVGRMSGDLLLDQGYDLTDYRLFVNSLWAQKFSKLGGGHHNSHTHGDAHVAGFYFLQCTENTSFPVFHDPRPGKSLVNLPEKNENNITEASSQIHFKPHPGMFIFFPSYLPHQFTVDSGIDKFKFIHFSVQAIPKRYKLSE